MHDPAAVRARQRVGHLRAELEHLGARQRALCADAAPALPVQVLHHQEVGPVLGPDVVQHADVGVIEGGDGAGFELEPVPPLWVGGETGGQDLDRDRAIEPRVAGPVHLAHTASPNGGEDLVRTQAGAGREGHSWTAGIVAPEDSGLRAQGSRVTNDSTNVVAPASWPASDRLRAKVGIR